MNGAREWTFYTRDEDHSTDWDNHTEGLFRVATGVGDTPQQAWADVMEHGRADEFIEYEPAPAMFTCIPGDAEQYLHVDENGKIT